MYSTQCSVEGCETYQYCKGYCQKHYGRYKRYGDATHPGKLFRPKAEPGEIVLCTIEGCNELYSAKGLCKRHYIRQYSYGDLNVSAKKKVVIRGENRHKHPLYKLYHGMLDRCRNPNHKYYEYYGGRGLGVHERWLGPNGFPHFIEDMGERPKGMTLERIDNDGDYAPNNVKWATRKEQRRNTRKQSNNSSGHVGVHLYKKTGKWSAYVTIQGKRKHLGYYATLKEAVAARERNTIHGR